MASFIFENEKIMRELRLTQFAEIIIEMLDNPDFDGLAGHEYMDLALKTFYERRKGAAIYKKAKEAHVPYVDARLDTLEPNGELTVERIGWLKRMHWLEASASIIFCAQSGAGKSYATSALAMEAMLASYTVMYVRMLDFSDVVARIESDPKFYKRLVTANLLVLDDFLLCPISASEQKMLCHILDEREQAREKRALLVASQCETKGWVKCLGSLTISDSLVNRLVHPLSDCRSTVFRLDRENRRATRERSIE